MGTAPALRAPDDGRVEARRVEPRPSPRGHRRLLADRGTSVVVGGGIVGFGVVFLALVRYGTGTVRSFEAGLTSRAARRPEA